MSLRDDITQAYDSFEAAQGSARDVAKYMANSKLCMEDLGERVAELEADLERERNRADIAEARLAGYEAEPDE